MQLHTPITYITNPDLELVRNRVWQQIARTMGPFLQDQPEDIETQLEVIRNCYVSTPLAKAIDKSLDALLKDVPQNYLQDAKCVDLKPGEHGRTAFSHRIRDDVHHARRGAYILTGGVGSGKTTFLKRFANIVDPDCVRRYTVTNLTVRYERVRASLEYLEQREVEELALSAGRVGPFQEELMPQICAQIEAEIKIIVQKTGAEDTYGDE